MILLTALAIGHFMKYLSLWGYVLSNLWWVCVDSFPKPDYVLYFRLISANVSKNPPEV